MNKYRNMERAIELAENAMENGNTPFGAVIVKDGAIIAEAENQVTSKCDITAHAELNVIRKATTQLGSNDLSECELYASGEPCSMCLSAIYYSNLKNVYVAYRKEEAMKYKLTTNYIYEQVTLEEEKRDIRYIDLRPERKTHLYEYWKRK